MISQVIAMSIVSLVGWLSVFRRYKGISIASVTFIHAVHLAVGLALFLGFLDVPMQLRLGLSTAVGIGMAPITGLLVALSRSK